MNRWSHLAVTYDGATLQLYVNGARVSSRAVTGTIPRSDDPSWIGGNHPYGEYFDGLIDEVRVYDRVLTASQVRAEMSTPIAGSRTSRAAGLVGAYSFDRGSGSVAADVRAEAMPGRSSERPGLPGAGSAAPCGSTATTTRCGSRRRHHLTCGAP